MSLAARLLPRPRKSFRLFGLSGACIVASASMLSACSGDGDEDDTTRVVQLRSFAVPPGGEVFKCQEFANPFSGEKRYVTKIRSSMAAGSHHLLLFAKRFAQDKPIEDCVGTEFDTPGIYGAQEQVDEMDFPPGIGIVVEPGMGFRVQSHYVNPGASYIGVNVKLEFELAPRGTALEPAGLILISQDNFSIPPRSTGKIEKTCTLKADLNLVIGQAHMHSHGKQMRAYHNDQMIYESNDWSHPAKGVFNSKQLKKGDVLHHECLVENATDRPITFGESAVTNEMCIFGVIVYPYPEIDGTTPYDPCEEGN